METLNFEDFMKKCMLKKITMNESELRRTYDYHIYPRTSKIYSDKGFFNKDKWFQGVL